MAETKRVLPNEEEIALLKGAFSENEVLLKAIRTLLFGFDVTDSQKELIKSAFSNPDVKKAFRKKIYPVLDPNVPVGQVADFWMGTETQVFGGTRDAVYQSIESKKLVQAMLDQAMDLLDNPDGDKIDLDIMDIMADPLQVKLLARNIYIRTIETGLMYVNIVAGQKSETPEEAKKRLEADSTK